MAATLGIDELVVNTITWDHAARLRSYELLAREFGFPGEPPATCRIMPQNGSGSLIQRSGCCPRLWSCLYLPLSLAHAQVDVLTQHNDNSRTGVNLHENVLTPSTVNKTPVRPHALQARGRRPALYATARCHRRYGWRRSAGYRVRHHRQQQRVRVRCERCRGICSHMGIVNSARRQTCTAPTSAAST